jgi:hypothetical protein
MFPEASAPVDFSGSYEYCGLRMRKTDILNPFLFTG